MYETLHSNCQHSPTSTSGEGPSKVIDVFRENVDILVSSKGFTREPHRRSTVYVGSKGGETDFPYRTSLMIETGGE